VLVDGAETLRPEAANALLKTLEEPPPRSVLMLTTAAPDRLVPTIRSRCRRLQLAPLSATETGAVLRGLRPDMPEADRARLAAMAEGSPGGALALAEGDGLAIQALVEEVLDGLAAGDRRRWHAVADAVAAKRDGSAFATFVALLRRAISAPPACRARAGHATCLARHPSACRVEHPVG
jgi:DNA polymerase-3 subunit delta'